MSSTEENVLIPGNFKLGKELFTSALLNNQNEIRTQSTMQGLFRYRRCKTLTNNPGYLKC